MKTTFISLNMCLLLSLTLCQGFNNTRKTFFSGGGCSQIRGVGSPVLMAANAHKYINDALDSKNPYTGAKFIYYSRVADTTVTGRFRYKLIFEISNFSGVQYLGAEFDNTDNGIGGMTIHRMILLKNLAVVGTILSIADIANNVTTINCGDLKYVFSFYGQDPTADLPFAYPGRNQNSIGLNTLSQLNSYGWSGDAEYKVCIDANYERIDGFLAIAGVDDINGGVNEEFKCFPTKVSVDSINVSCNDVAGGPTHVPGGGTGDLSYLQVVFNNLTDDLTTDGTAYGTVATPIAEIENYKIDDAVTVTFNRYGTDTFQIITNDASGAELVNFVCGRTAVGVPTQTETMPVREFLGFEDIGLDAGAAFVDEFDIVKCL